MAVADRHGLPVAICVESATPHEVKFATSTLIQMIVPEAPQNLIGDNAYDSDNLDAELRQYGIELIAPHRSNRRNTTQDLRRMRWYRRRWKIEMSFRYGKSELAMESPRLWSWENRLKLLGLVTLVYTFLLFLLNPLFSETIELLFQLKCHRTGKRCQDALAPLYRLRWALSRLWNDAPPILGCFFPPNLDTLRAFAAFGTLNGFSQNQG